MYSSELNSFCCVLRIFVLYNPAGERYATPAAPLSMWEDLLETRQQQCFKMTTIVIYGIFLP